MAGTDTKEAVATNAKEAIAYCEENDVRFVRLWFTDLLGQLKSFSIHAAELDDAFEGGMGFDGSSITGFNPIEESAMIALPQPPALRLLRCGVGHAARPAGMLRHLQVP